MARREPSRIYSFTPDIGLRSRAGLRRDPIRLVSIVGAVTLTLLIVFGGGSFSSDSGAGGSW